MRLALIILICVAAVVLGACRGESKGIAQDTFEPKAASTTYYYTVSGSLWDPCGTSHGNRVENQDVEIWIEGVTKLDTVSTDSNGDFTFEDVPSNDNLTDYVVYVKGLFMQGLQPNPADYKITDLSCNVTLQRFALYGLSYQTISGTITPGEEEVSESDCENVMVAAQFWQDSVYVNVWPGNVLTDENGYYEGSLADSTYQLIPSKSGFYFVQDGWSGSLHVNGSNVSSLDWKMYKY